MAGATGVVIVHSVLSPEDIGIAVEGRFVTVSLPRLTTAEIHVYNIIGRTQYARSTHGSRVVLDLSDIPRGVYFLRIATSFGTVVRRLALFH